MERICCTENTENTEGMCTQVRGCIINFQTTLRSESLQLTAQSVPKRSVDTTEKTTHTCSTVEGVH